MNEQVTQYIQRAPEKQRQMMEAIRQVIHEEVPSVVENYKWSRPVFAASGDFVYFKSSKDYLTFGIFKFNKITGHKELLEGTGKDMRHFKIRELQDMKPEVLRDWIRQMTGKGV